MYDFFKQLAQHNYCQSNGVCSIHPSINSLSELILNEVREICSYIVKLKEYNIIDYDIISYIIEVLSIKLINTSFSENDYLKVIKKIHQFKIEVKEKYIEYCKIKRLPCEILNTEFEINNFTTVSDLIKFSEENITNRQKGCENKKIRLFELITSFARLCAINIIKIKKLNPDFTKYDFEIIRFFALTNGYSIRNEKIIRRIKEFSNVALLIRNELSDTLQNKYGLPENSEISLYAKKGHCILVSGDDFDELEDILKEAEKYKENINIYTNGELFLSHFYPYFKNNKYLKGHWGKNETEYDFSNFPGAIFMTKNFNQKIDNLYKGELFSSKLISFKKVYDIKNKNYLPIFDSAFKTLGFIKDENKETCKIEYNYDKIINLINKIEDEEVIIIAGNKNAEIQDKYKDKTIININFPYTPEKLVKIIQNCIQKNIKPILFFMECNKTSLESLLILIGSNIRTAIADCSYSLINPHAVESLKEDFNVKII